MHSKIGTLSSPLLLLLASLLCSCTVTGKRNFLLNRLATDSIRGSSADLKTYEKKYFEYDGVYLSREHSIEHVRSYDLGGDFWWDTYTTVVQRYVVLNPDAERLTTFRLGMENGDNLMHVYLTVIAPDGSIREFDETDLYKEQDSDGERVYKLAYPGVVKGTIIDERYEIYRNAIRNPEHHHEIPLQFSLPCERLSVKYVYPISWTISTKHIDSAKNNVYQIVEDPKNKLSVLRYDTSDVAAVTEQAYSPYRNEFAQYLDIALQSVKFGPGSIPVAPESWMEYAAEYRDYALDKGVPQSRIISKQMEKIVEESDPPVVKMKKIVAWVQKEIAIDWDSPYADFRSILKNKQGNRYLICGLTRAMLENAGIPSSLLLIHSAEEGYFDSAYLHWDVFYQPGVTAEIDGRKFYLFPWIKNYPVEQVPVYFQGQPALVIAKKEYGGFETIPYGSSAGNKVESGYDVEIDEEGVMRVTETREFHGEEAYELRRRLDGLKEEKLEKEIRDMLSYEGGEVKLEKYEVEKLDDYSQPLVVRMTYTIDNLVTVTSDEAIVRSEGLFSPATRTGYKLDTVKRTNPIRIYNDERYLKRVSVRVPAGWQLVETPKPVSEKNRFGEVSARYSYADGVLTVEHARTLQRSSGTAAEIGELQAIVGKRSKLNVPTLVFKVE